MPPCDITIIAGDITPTYTHAFDFQRRWVEDNFTPWAESLPCDEVILIAGNHDFLFERQDFDTWALWDGTKIHYLEDQSIHMIVPDNEVISFYGTPWSNKFGPWAFMKSEDELREIYAEIPERTDILVSHNPPHGFGDMTANCERVGSTSLRKRIMEVKPKLVVCGHIHEAAGFYRYAGARIINASLRNENYEVTNLPILVEV
jgi:Icc-related predicted phosphoesterase